MSAHRLALSPLPPTIPPSLSLCVCVCVCVCVWLCACVCACMGPGWSSPLLGHESVTCEGTHVWIWALRRRKRLLGGRDIECRWCTVQWSRGAPHCSGCHCRATANWLLAFLSSVLLTPLHRLQLQHQIVVQDGCQGADRTYSQLRFVAHVCTCSKA